MRFQYYSGSGNSFLISSCRPDEMKELTQPHIIHTIAHSATPAVDGVLLLEVNPPELPFYLRMHYFNRDGSRASMCGNGLRSIARFAYDTQALDTDSMIIETDCGPRSAKIFPDSTVEVDMGLYPYNHLSSENAAVKSAFIPITETPSFSRWGYITNTGVPHVVFFSSAVDEEPVFNLGKIVRHSPLFHPHGTNVNFAEIISLKDWTVRLRTYERGVEDETGACGTGASATALTLSHVIPFLGNECERTIKVVFHSSEEASIRLKKVIQGESVYLRLSLRAGVEAVPSKSFEFTLDNELLEKEPALSLSTQER